MAPALSGALRLRLAAFEAGALAGAAASAYASLLLLLRTTGSARVTGLTVAVVLLSGLLLAAREPAAVAAAVRRRQDGALLAGLALGAAIAAVGAGGRLLFLPALLTIAALGALTGPHRALAAAALATAGLLLPLLTEPAAVGDHGLLALTALALLLAPTALAVVVDRLAAAPQPEPPPPPAPEPIPVNLLVSETSRFTGIAEEAPRQALTPRQTEAVALAVQGLRHAEIAERMGISIHQVRRLLRQGRERVHARTTRELVAWAMMEGIVASAQGTETEARPSGD